MQFARIVLLVVIGSLVSESTCDDDLAVELLKRYYDMSTECLDAHNQTQPAYQCSGIIMRGIIQFGHPSKFSWGLKPTDAERNSFSWGFLRTDYPFAQLGRGNYAAGFIIYPLRHKIVRQMCCVHFHWMAGRIRVPIVDVGNSFGIQSELVVNVTHKILPHLRNGYHTTTKVYTWMKI